MNSSMDGQLTGMIEYQGKTDTHEVLFGDRDTEDSIILQKGICLKSEFLFCVLYLQAGLTFLDTWWIFYKAFN